MVPLNGSDLEDLLLMMSFFQNCFLEVESVDLVIHLVDLFLVRSCLVSRPGEYGLCRTESTLCASHEVLLCAP